MTGMFMSGWEIYNASPIYNFHFPSFLTLGGWLGGAIGWHLAVMWIMFFNGALYLIHGLLSGHLKSDIFSFSLADLRKDLLLSIRLKISHKHQSYNAVQKASYVAVIGLLMFLVISGMAIWKPVQLSWLTNMMGGFDTARVVHFYSMSLTGLFIIVHIIMVLLFPKTLIGMFSGGKRD